MISRSQICMALAMALVSTAAFATPDNLVQGVAVYAKGDAGFVGASAFGAGTVANQLFDDGTNGDAVSGDNTYTSPILTATAAGTFNFKVADDNYNPVNTPDAGFDNLKATVTIGQTYRVFLKTTPFADGYLPEAGAGVFADGFVWSSATRAAIDAATSVKAVGSFQDELGGASEWNADAVTGNQAVLLDNGLSANGDTTAGDGIYAVKLTGIAAGTYSYKIILNNSYDPVEIGTLGFAKQGNGNLSISVVAPTDNIVLLLNANTGRTTYTNDNPLANAGPPWYATSTAWSSALGAATILNDAGTDGDLTAADGVYSRTFTVVTPGIYNFAIRQGIGSSFGQAGGTGGYPFETWEANQVVRAIFDTNTYADGYVPTSNIVFALATTPVTSLNRWARVAPVGQLAAPFAFSDWNANDLGVNLADDGAAPDGTANNFIYSRSFAEQLPATNQQIKFVYNRTSTPSGYDIQGGGPTDGITVGPDNNPSGALYTFDGAGNTVFAVDAVTGRARVAGTYAAPADRAARSHFTSFTSVSDWTMF